MIFKIKFPIEEKGGPGSGFHGHSGRPGKVGGSSGGSGGSGGGSFEESITQREFEHISPGVYQSYGFSTTKPTKSAATGIITDDAYSEGIVVHTTFNFEVDEFDDGTYAYSIYGRS